MGAIEPLLLLAYRSTRTARPMGAIEPLPPPRVQEYASSSSWALRTPSDAPIAIRGSLETRNRSGTPPRTSREGGRSVRCAHARRRDAHPRCPHALPAVGGHLRGARQGGRAAEVARRHGRA